MAYAYITSRGRADMYYNNHLRYNHPFIGSIFVNDGDFVKLSRKLDYYLTLTPMIIPPKHDSRWAQQNGSEWIQGFPKPYPVLQLGDMEIHYPYDMDGNNVLEKFERRTNRFLRERPTPKFIWSDMDLMNQHPIDRLTHLVSIFTQNSPDSIYFTKHPDLACFNRVYVVDRWVGEDTLTPISFESMIHQHAKAVSLSFRADIPVTNTCRITSCDHQGEYTASIYKVREGKGEIRILRHDEEEGWENMEVIVDEEQISLPSCPATFHSYSVDIDTPLTEIRVDKQKIPKTIIQTNTSARFLSLYALNAQRSVLDANPEYAYEFFSDTDRRKFVAENFPENITKAYDVLFAEQDRCDLFSYCYLFLKGGCYIHNRVVLYLPIRMIIQEEDTLVICRDENGNDMIFAEPYNDAILAAIHTCVRGVLQNIPDSPQLAIDGLHTNIGSRIVERESSGLGTYKEWSMPCEGGVFKDYTDIGRWFVSVYPHVYNDIFVFILKGSSTLHISRDNGEGWWLELQLKVTNKETHISRVVNVGRSGGQAEVDLSGY